ncbi:MAG: energy transducer TonB [Acidobacteriota bacterium]|nr:energy transducer TonB [Acidobacteriota bacterium]
MWCARFSFAALLAVATAGELKLVTSVSPKYSEEAKAKGIQGDVVVHLDVDLNGDVDEAWVVRGPMELRDAAVVAARQWKFDKAGPLPGSTEMAISFRLPDGERLTATRGTQSLYEGRVVGGAKPGAVVTQPKVIRHPEPVYPDRARLDHIQGRVVLWLTIGRDGQVKAIEALSGDRLLVPAAIDAVKQWTFQPALEDGRPVTFASSVEVNFQTR